MLALGATCGRDGIAVTALVVLGYLFAVGWLVRWVADPHSIIRFRANVAEWRDILFLRGVPVIGLGVWVFLIAGLAIAASPQDALGGSSVIEFAVTFASIPLLFLANCSGEYGGIIGAIAGVALIVGLIIVVSWIRANQD
jgi:hypothetical protein